MKTVLLVVGRTVDKRLGDLIADYVGRVKHYLPFEMVVVPELKNTKALTEAQQKEKEGELLLRCLQPGDEVVLLDEGANLLFPSMPAFNNEWEQFYSSVCTERL